MIRLLSVYLSLGLISGAISLAATSILTHTLSPVDYGIGMLFISSLQLIGMLCCMGMDRVFMRYFYEKKYRDNVSFLLYYCLSFVGIGFLIFFAITSFFTDFFTKFFHFNGWLIWSLAAIGVFFFILEIFASLMPRIQGRPSLYALGQIVQQSTFLFSIILFLSFSKKSGLIIINSQIIALAACSIVLIYFYKADWKIPKKLFRKLKLKDMKGLISYGTPFVFANGFTWIFFNIDKFLLLKWSNTYELGIYTAASVLSLPLEALRSTFMQAWMPRCNQLVTEAPFKEKEIFHKVFHKALWGFTLVTSILLLLKSVLILFLGNSFHQAETIFGWLLLSIYFYGLSDIVTAGILKSKRTVWNIAISFLCLSSNVVACYFLIPHLGARGAALANTISFGVFFIMRYIIGFQYYQFKIFRWKLILYTFYLCGAIELTNLNYFYWQLIIFIFFIFISFFSEKEWLMPYLKKAIKYSKLSFRYFILHR